MNTAMERVTADLAAAGIAGTVTILDASAKTAALAAAQLGVSVGAIANSLIFDCDGVPLLILTSGAHRVNTQLVASRLGLASINRASPDFVRHHTGQVIGGVAPVGHPQRLRTLVDRELLQFPTVWAAAGHHSAVFAISSTDLVRLTQGEVVDVE